jgi:hypothetical protein
MLLMMSDRAPNSHAVFLLEELVGSQTQCSCYAVSHTECFCCTHAMFVLALKRVVLVSMRASVVAGRQLCSAVGTRRNGDCWPDVGSATRVVLALSKSTGTSRLVGTPRSSMQAGLPLLPVRAVAVESTKCLAKLKLLYDWQSSLTTRRATVEVF